MSLWRAILRWFGLYREARVQITAPGIEVTLVGEPAQVRTLTGVIRTELERKARRDRRLNNKPQSEVVLPTELDEMDSPYALPEAVVLPVPHATHPSLVSPSGFEPDDIESVRTALTPHPEEGPTPPLAQGLRAMEHSDVDTLEVDRFKRETRPLHPTVKPDGSS